jgi:replication factor C small subunit
MSTQLSADLLWVEKYRPRKFEELVLSEDNGAALRKFLEDESIPHLLLVGAVGSGKTTIAKMLLEALDCDRLELNASDERGIETVRTRIKGFLMAQGLCRWRVAFLDEADALTTDAQFSLRNTMERFSDRGRFILTANYIEKIIEPIRSRCQVMHFSSLPKKAVFQRAKYVLEAEGVSYEMEGVLQAVEDHYPDVRRVVNALQLGTSKGRFTYRAQVQVMDQIRARLREKDLLGIREIVVNQRPDYTMMYRGLFDKLPELSGDRGKLSVMGVTIGEYLYRDAIVADREINFAAMCLELMKEL